MIIVFLFGIQLKQIDTDSDEIGDACYLCPKDNAQTPDFDEDGVGIFVSVTIIHPKAMQMKMDLVIFVDNCPEVSNSDPANSDYDYAGDTCDNCHEIATSTPSPYRDEGG